MTSAFPTRVGSLPSFAGKGSSPMIVQTLLSGWVGFLLTCLMVFCVAIGLHSEDGPSGSEQVLAFGSTAVFMAWLVAKGSFWLHTNTRRAGDR